MSSLFWKCFRHHREDSDWHFDPQKQRSEAAHLWGLSGSHRQGEISLLLSFIQSELQSPASEQRVSENDFLTASQVLSVGNNMCLRWMSRVCLLSFLIHFITSCVPDTWNDFYCGSFNHRFHLWLNLQHLFLCIFNMTSNSHSFCVNSGNCCVCGSACICMGVVVCCMNVSVLPLWNDGCVYITLQSLLEDVKGDTHGDFESLLVALITPPAVYDCHEVMRAMKVSFHFLSERFSL